MMETLPPRNFDTRVCSQTATHPEGQGFLATRRPDAAMLIVRERFPTRNRIRSYAVRPDVKTIKLGHESTHG